MNAARSSSDRAVHNSESTPLHSTVTLIGFSQTFAPVQPADGCGARTPELGAESGHSPTETERCGKSADITWGRAQFSSNATAGRAQFSSMGRPPVEVRNSCLAQKNSGSRSTCVSHRRMCMSASYSCSQLFSCVRLCAKHVWGGALVIKACLAACAAPSRGPRRPLLSTSSRATARPPRKASHRRELGWDNMSVAISIPRAKDELRAAVRQCSDRGLRCSSKWAAEQLIGLRSPVPSDDQEMSSSSPAAAIDEEDETEDESDTMLLAKAYFDANEFLRAAHALRNARAARGRFLRWYSLFLAGEKRKDERTLEEAGGSTAAVPTGRPRAVNEQLVDLHSELQAEAQAGRLDGYGQYVYGLVLRELQRSGEACAAFKAACALCPCFWSAWTEMAAALPNLAELEGLELPSHWMSAFFRAHAAIEAQQNVPVPPACRSPLAARRPHHTCPRGVVRLVDVSPYGARVPPTHVPPPPSAAQPPAGDHSVRGAAGGIPLLALPAVPARTRQVQPAGV